MHTRRLVLEQIQGARPCAPANRDSSKNVCASRIAEAGAGYLVLRTDGVLTFSCIGLSLITSGVTYILPS
ncbi:uncharacterized protein LAESUDRAFT_725294 [Laetiporus sulphureus 93-53]|uniref:Uncharacterized protein n=1 Tax=Laetiporus sulphureus 93-53 TaxID=1314785 RepID=A0A165EG07_9APHY|nr:uncharacterized protein LAESUDRAFT_725294 [Laetiporus sulphureus 93-53]KZT06981.1 hypothetical protein LAESUDRAFT_725294 [Laetiporus sulphureus 93-53]